MIVEGLNVVRELVNAKAQINKITYSNKSAQHMQIVEQAQKNGIKVFYEEDKTKISAQGIQAEVPNFKYCQVEDILKLAENKNEKPFIVVLDGIEDPHNLGAIIRSAECAGVHGIIIPTNRSAEVNPTVYKTSAGAVVHMLVSRVVNLARTIETLKQAGVWVYALEAGGQNIYSENFTYPTALVVGSEGKGVSRLVKEKADVVVSLNMFGKVNSLNASNAGAIAMYEVVRQRGGK